MFGKPENANWWHWLGLVLLVVAIDLATKAWASSSLVYGQPVELLPVFDLRLLHNTGAAFSFLASAGGWQRWLFTSITLVVSVMILLWMRRVPKEQWWLSLALGLILGGALGNLWDRVTLGHVVDFISVHWDEHYFPAFNIADSAITVGTCLMLLDIVLQKDEQEVEEKA